MNEDKKKELLEAIKEYQGVFLQWELELTEKMDSFWNSLNEEQKLLAFCSVSKRIHQGEIKDDKTYRGILYDVFKFGPESYVPAQFCGYLDIHNAIANSSSRKLFLDNLKQLLKDNNISDQQIEKICQEASTIYP